MVSVKSAKWRDRYFKGILHNTDHLNEVGWSSKTQMISGKTETNLLDRIHEFYLQVAGALP
jgi:hypothetical protein